MVKLQTVKKSAKLSRMARHLIENCGLISWLSSIVTSFCGIKYDDWKGFPFAQFAVVLEVYIYCSKFKLPSSVQVLLPKRLI